MTDASLQPPAERLVAPTEAEASPPAPVAPPEVRAAFEPVSDIELERLMDRARSLRSHHLGAMFLLAPLGLLALLVFIAVIA